MRRWIIALALALSGCGVTYGNGTIPSSWHTPGIDSSCLLEASQSGIDHMRIHVNRTVIGDLAVLFYSLAALTYNLNPVATSIDAWQDQGGAETQIAAAEKATAVSCPPPLPPRPYTDAHYEVIEIHPEVDSWGIK